MALLIPEFILIATGMFLLLGDVFCTQGKIKTFSAWIAMAGTLLSLAYVVGGLPTDGEALGGRFAVDAVAWWFKVAFLISAAGAIAISEASVEIHSESRSEYYMVLLFAAAGMGFLASARDMVALYVSLELAGVPLYLLATWRKDALSSEAGLKFLILGAIASVFLLYGLSLLYGITGSLDLLEVGRSAHLGLAFWLAVALVVAAAGFKMSVAPFHLWTPDVYQGAPTPVTAYLSVGSKSAALALMFHLFYVLMGRDLASLAPMFAVLAAITMTWGNVAAILQKNVKRLLAFSGISQAGYLIIGFIGIGRDSSTAMLYYLLVYVLTNLAVFAVVGAFSGQRKCDEVSDFRGLSRTNPILALSMALALFSLAGIPPLSGFVGKFFLFSVASQEGMHWLVALAAVNSTVSLFYYLRFVREMYIEAPTAETTVVRVHPALVALLVVTVGSMLALGIAPNLYNSIQAQAASWTETRVK